MKRGILTTIITIAILAVLIAGCAPRQTGREQFQEEFRQGTEGLRIGFVQNMPPPRLFDTDEANIGIEVENRGVYDVGSAGDRIYLSGFDPTIITGIPTTGLQIPKLEGRDQFRTQGDFDTLFFKGTIAPLKAKKIDRYPVRLLATACYGYETIASRNVCIDPNPYAPTTVQKVCTPTSVAFGTQGAPIAVTRVDVEASPGKTRFKIYIQNVGGGNVFRYGAQYLNKCSPYSREELMFDELDYVELADVFVSGVSIKQTCKPLDQNSIRLTNNQAVLFCEFTQARGGSAYTTPLTISLRYGYRTVVFKDFEIVSS